MWSFLFFSHTPVINLGTQSSHLGASHWLADSLESEPSLAREDVDGQGAGGPAEQAVQVRFCLFSWSRASLLPQTQLLMWGSSFSLRLGPQSRVLLLL